MDFGNDQLDEWSNWLEGLAPREHLTVGLEDANSYGIHLVAHLTAENIPLRYVPAILTERERTHSITRRKSDAVDAKRVGRVLLTKYADTLPARESIASKKECTTARTLDLLLMEREDLVRSKTILKNQLHGLLHQRYTESYRTHCPRSFSKKAIRWFLEDLRGEASVLAHGITRRFDRLRFVETQIARIDKDLKAASEAAPDITALATIYGCGTLTACSILAEVVTARRFTDKHRFAAYAGVTPIPHSSGRKNRLHTNPFGNRKLNRAIHTIALSQIALKHEPAIAYYEKKLKEGKTKLWALRCLKHQIAKHVFQVLKNA